MATANASMTLTIVINGVTYSGTLAGTLATPNEDSLDFSNADNSQYLGILGA